MTTIATPEAPEPSAPEPIRPGTLEIRGITKAFPNVQALTDISLDVHPGEILALMGENGAGKSTLLKILSGVQPPSAGVRRWHFSPLSLSPPALGLRYGRERSTAW